MQNGMLGDRLVPLPLPLAEAEKQGYYLGRHSAEATKQPVVVT